jgi:hypothetical protein
MNLNVSGCHPPGIQGDDLIVEAGKAALTLGEDHQLEACVPITGDINIEITEISFDTLSVIADGPSANTNSLTFVAGGLSSFRV